MSYDDDDYSYRARNNNANMRDADFGSSLAQNYQMEVPSITSYANAMSGGQIPLYYPVHIHAGVIRQRIDGVRNAFAPLCASLQGYAKRSSRMRDAGDQISKRLFQLAEHCNYNASMQGALLNFSRWVSALQDCENTRAMRVNAKVVDKLANYEQFCARVEDEIKTGEISSLKHKQTMFSGNMQQGGNMNSMHNTRDALSNYRDTARTMDSSLSAIQQAADQFEHKKLTDLKQIMHDYVLIELKYHCKALEMYSEAYCTLKTIDIAPDPEEYRQQREESARAADSMDEQIDEQQQSPYRGTKGNREQQPPPQRERRPSQQQQQLQQQQQQQPQQPQQPPRQYPWPDAPASDWGYGTDFYDQQERDRQQLQQQSMEYYLRGYIPPPQPQPPQMAQVPGMPPGPNQQYPDGLETSEFSMTQQQPPNPAADVITPFGRKKKRNTMFLSTPAPQYAASIIVPKPEKMRRQVVRKWWPLSRNASTTATTANAPMSMPPMPPNLTGTMSLSSFPMPPPQTMKIEIPVAGSYVMGGEEKARIREKIRRRLEDEFGAQTNAQVTADSDRDNIQDALEEQIAARTKKMTARGGGGAAAAAYGGDDVDGGDADLQDLFNDFGLDDMPDEPLAAPPPPQTMRRKQPNNRAAGVATKPELKYDETTTTTTTKAVTTKPLTSIIKDKSRKSAPPGKTTPTPKKRTLKIAAHATSYHVTDYDHGLPTIFSVPPTTTKRTAVLPANEDFSPPPLSQQQHVIPATNLVQPMTVTQQTANVIVTTTKVLSASAITPEILPAMDDFSGPPLQPDNEEEPQNLFETSQFMVSSTTALQQPSTDDNNAEVVRTTSLMAQRVDAMLANDTITDATLTAPIEISSSSDVPDEEDKGIDLVLQEAGEEEDELQVTTNPADAKPEMSQDMS